MSITRFSIFRSFAFLSALACLLLSLPANAISSNGQGRLSLVGMGPGDPDLATVRALRVLEQADIVYTFGGSICQRFAGQLVGKEVRTLSFHLFSRAFLGGMLGKKTRDTADSKPPEQQRQALFDEIRAAVRQGQRVAIIDGGDPLIFGPWVWVLREFADLDPQVVPGVSAFNAGLAAIKRDGTWAPDSHSVVLTTDRPGERDRLEQLAAHRTSMVIFTHKTRLADIAAKLQTSYPPATPVAIVLYAGHRDRQQVLHATLATLLDRVTDRNLPFENILFVGDFLSYGFPQSESEKQDKFTQEG